jgi:hypothetical protein
MTFAVAGFYVFVQTWSILNRRATAPAVRLDRGPVFGQRNPTRQDLLV